MASWANGKVLDIEIFSEYCRACASRSDMDKSASEELMDWWEGHQAVYQANYEVSSNAMESSGAMNIWQRSLSKYKLRYTKMISDGDSKSFKNLVKA